MSLNEKSPQTYDLQALTVFDTVNGRGGGITCGDPLWGSVKTTKAKFSLRSNFLLVPSPLSKRFVLARTCHQQKSPGKLGAFAFVVLQRRGDYLR
jgi:hypothetical protein